MNRQKSIAFFAAIATVSMITIGLSGVSTTPLMLSSIPQTQESVGMLGHVEYVVRDSTGIITAYIQGDNAVVDDGKDCAAKLLFGTSEDGGCDNGITAFDFIGIGNVTGTFGSDTNFKQLNTTAAFPYTNSCSGQPGGGEMARKLVTPTIITPADEATNGAIVELDLDTPFQFDAGNATTVHQSGIFSDDFSTPGKTTEPNGGQCLTSGVAGTDWSMFALQNLNTGSGIQVTAGDSLSVKWTITIG